MSRSIRWGPFGVISENFAFRILPHTALTELRFSFCIYSGNANTCTYIRVHLQITSSPNFDIETQAPGSIAIGLLGVLQNTLIEHGSHQRVYLGSRTHPHVWHLSRTWNLADACETDSRTIGLLSMRSSSFQFDPTQFYLGNSHWYEKLKSQFFLQNINGAVCILTD